MIHGSPLIERQDSVDKQALNNQRNHWRYIVLQDDTQIRVSDETYKNIHTHDFISKPAVIWISIWIAFTQKQIGIKRLSLFIYFG